MRTISTALKTHLALEFTTVCSLWLLATGDQATGLSLAAQFFAGAFNTAVPPAGLRGYTDHDTHIDYLGVRFHGSAGYTSTAVKSSSDLSIDEVAINGFLSDTGLTAAQLEAGLFDGARVVVMGVNWADLSMGHWIKRVGNLADVQRDGTIGFAASQHGLTSKLANNVGRIDGPDCDAVLGDSRCTVSLAALTKTGAVTTVTDRRTFVTNLPTLTPVPAAGYFDQGLVTWTSGANVGLKMEVKSYAAGGALQLQLAMPYVVAVGDAFSISPGCDKAIGTCKAKFNNVVNFRGIPWLPGNNITQAGL